MRFYYQPESSDHFLWTAYVPPQSDHSVIITSYGPRGPTELGRWDTGSRGHSELVIAWMARNTLCFMSPYDAIEQAIDATSRKETTRYVSTPPL